MEVKDKKTGEWVAYTFGNNGRDYRWFNIVAGVRGEGENTVAAPKGIPKDAGLVVQRELEEDNLDLHSHSWLSLSEISEAYRRYVDECILNDEDEVIDLIREAAGQKQTYKEKVEALAKNNNDGYYDKDILPEYNNIRWSVKIDDNLNLSVEDYLWYNDVRFVFAFDN